MARIYDTISSLIKPGRISSAAATLGETVQKVSASVDTILPALLARVIKAGNSTEVRAVVEDAGELGMHKDYNQIWDGNGIFDGKNMGERMENRLLGIENPEFYSAVAAHTGIKKENADRLTNWVAATIAAYLGEKIMSGKTYLDILDELEGEKDGLRKDIPMNIIKLLGLEQAFGLQAVSGGTKKPVAEKKKSHWWLWLLLAIALLAIILCWRSCDRRKNTGDAATVLTEQVSQTATVDNNAAWDKKMPQGVTMTLPDGQKVTVYQDACEECMEAFLRSDKFKNATEAELRTVWFQMSDINFEHNSATELIADGEKQVRKIADMLKKYPDVKVKVGAFADKTGTRAVNYRITEQRAENIEKAFEKAGVKDANISTEGFGEQYANIPADASDAERAIDRDIALRFTK